MKKLFHQYFTIFFLFCIILIGITLFFSTSFTENLSNSKLYLLFACGFVLFTTPLLYYISHLKQESDSLKNLIRKYENPDDTKNKIALIGKMSVAVVHDLKNPMSTIQTLVEMANTDEITKEERIRNLNLIHREISRLSDMAYEILDFVKGDLVLHPET
jgi:signal transduction histidine kinase